jgi:hypothetical protein
MINSEYYVNNRRANARTKNIVFLSIEQRYSIRVGTYYVREYSAMRNF